MGTKAKLTTAVLLAMGATGTAAPNNQALSTDQSLGLPSPGAAEYEAAALGVDDGAMLALVKKKAKKKIKCVTAGGKIIAVPPNPVTGGCPPGFYKKKKA